MTTKVIPLLLLVTAAVARQDISSHTKDQDTANDKVTSILIQPGPGGPRHVILSDEHQMFPAEPARAELSSRVGNHQYHLVGYTAAPPRLATYGPASPVLHHHPAPQQLYHHRFAQERYQAAVDKNPRYKQNKDESKAHTDAISKYASFIKHNKHKQVSNDRRKEYSNRNYEKPDYSVTVPEKDYRRPQHDDEYSFHENFHDDEESKFRESIGEFAYDDKDYSHEKKYRPTKYYSKQKNSHSDNKFYYPVKNYQAANLNDDEEDSYRDNPSGFDDKNGGQVVPLVARFYKQPLPIIQTQLPVDNSGLYVQYLAPHTSAYQPEPVNDNYYDYIQKRSDVNRNNYPSESEWIPINAPIGSVSAKRFNTPAPNLSQKATDIPNKISRREIEVSDVVVGKIKQSPSVNFNHQLSENSEGVVSAIVRVKQ